MNLTLFVMSSNVICSYDVGTIGRQDGIVHALEERSQELSRQLSSSQSMIDQLREEKIILKVSRWQNVAIAHRTTSLLILYLLINCYYLK